jgi:chorismate mutase
MTPETAAPPTEAPAVDLAMLRAELDTLDDALHDLLMRRFAVVARLAREHFGAATPIRTHPTPARALAAVANGEASVAVLPAPAEEEAPEAAWWTRLDAPRLQVVARLPFFSPRKAEGGAPEALVVSVVPADPTGQDRSLIRLEGLAEQSRARLSAALAAAGLPPRSLTLFRADADGTAAAAMALAEVDGFLPGDAAGDARLANLPFADRAQILGAYAVPETGE